jgi:hypothetical protein
MIDERDVGIVVALGVILVLVGLFVGQSRGESLIKQEAIKAGVAYYTNNASGESVLKWKECK